MQNRLYIYGYDYLVHNDVIILLAQRIHGYKRKIIRVVIMLCLIISYLKRLLIKKVKTQTKNVAHIKYFMCSIKKALEQMEHILEITRC